MLSAGAFLPILLSLSHVTAPEVQRELGPKNERKNVFLHEANKQTYTIHFRFSVLTMMARTLQTHIRTTLGILVSDGVLLFRHAHVCHALGNRNV